MNFGIRKFIEKSSLYIFLILLAYMPFYVFISTWVGTNTGLLDAVKISKEIILVFGFVLALATTSKATIIRMVNDKLVWLIAGYAALTVALALIKPADQDAEAIGVVYNLRFLLFFIYGALLIQKVDKSLFNKTVKIVLAVGTIVSLLGVFQVALLPNDALASVGYSRANGTPVAFFISDQTQAIERAYSTAKDPNSFGSYLIIILTISLLFLFSKWPKHRNLFGGIVLAVTLCLFLTYSRSAWIGSIAALMVFVLLLPKTRQLLIKYKKIVISSGLIAIIIVSAGLFSLRNTSTVQNLIFHVGDDAEITSNSGRANALKYTTEEIIDNPLGYGPGTAGPASFKNDNQGAVISENYYLQLAHEVGVLGLALFVAICLVVAKRLYGSRNTDRLAIPLLASFAGIAITNMLVHIWFFEPVAYTWWGLAGLVLYAPRTKVVSFKAKKSKKPIK